MTDRSVVVSARFTEAEAAQVRELAGKRKVSEWVRDLVLRRLRGPDAVVRPPLILNNTMTSAAPVGVWWDCNAALVTGPPRSPYIWIAPPTGVGDQ